MLIVLLDEPGLFVFASADHARREIEPILTVLCADLVGERRTFDDTLTILRQMRSLLPPEICANMNATLVAYASSHQRESVIEWLKQFRDLESIICADRRGDQ
jgi:hypothetical protein